MAETDGAAIPARIRHQGLRAILNGFGTALGAARDPAVETAVRAMRAFSPGADATLIGRPDRLDPPGAAFANAIGMNLLDFDDTHLPTIIHPTAPVLPAVLALAEQRGLSGAEALTAFLLGAEVTCRIGDMVSPGHYARGWHITSTCGVFGAAAASARLLGLDAERTGHAIGIAAGLSGGLVENLTTAAKNAGVGNAPRNGILAALLAAEGYVAAPAAIEGKLGWAQACGDMPDVPRALDGLGKSWAFELNAYKPYPSGIVFHSVIDACFEIRASHALAADQIERVVVRGSPLLLQRGDRVVRNERDARVSLHHAAAIVFLYGAAGVREFEAACAMAPETVAFRSKVRGEVDSSLPPGAATVEVTLRDGQTQSATVLHARGSIERPMSDADLEAKLRALAGGNGYDAAEIIVQVWALDGPDSLGALMGAASGR
ncbi:MmgE/PrpD family protein [uncultured Enterovirga sp.]|uniref:MmgE/PrpD family protein n=1 Tax=uncultured Enterovirga sp. TaxID=2026352 RepID=UPI0035CB7CF9